jgi:membrane-bound serine protease (ClpP class)
MKAQSSLYFIFIFFILLISNPIFCSENDSVPNVYVFEIKNEIGKASWRTTQKAIDEANQKKVEYIIMHLNTYGGRVDFADSMRTKILNNKIPIIAFIDNQAISAGALISIACDTIYMRPGGSIGAATVVSQTGEAVPDKYQSFMRSTMRATAEAHGKDTIISGNDTVFKWHRDPKIAEAMVDPKIMVEGVSEEGQVLTLTADEAMNVNYCEGLAENIDEVLENAGLSEAKIEYYEKDGTEKFITFLLSTGVQSILVLLIIGGIYFELQTPGIGFPLGIAIVAALLYFAPLYVEGLAQNWELVAFIFGLILIGLEVFVIPGFGIAGLAGIVLVLTGLTMSLIDNVVFEFEGIGAFSLVVQKFVRMVLTVFAGFVLSIWLSKKVGTSNWFKGFALETSQPRNEGYIGVDTHQKDMIGKTGEAYTVLRPSGRVMIENELFDAKAEIGYIDKGEKIKVLRDEAGQLYVIKA